jgi:hypothetical protein
MPPAGFEPAIPASERLQTYTIDRPVTGNETPEFINENDKRMKSYKHDSIPGKSELATLPPPTSVMQINLVSKSEHFSLLKSVSASRLLNELRVTHTVIVRKILQISCISFSESHIRLMSLLTLTDFIEFCGTHLT